MKVTRVHISSYLGQVSTAHRGQAQRFSSICQSFVIDTQSFNWDDLSSADPIRISIMVQTIQRDQPSHSQANICGCGWDFHSESLMVGIILLSLGLTFRWDVNCSDPSSVTNIRQSSQFAAYFVTIYDIILSWVKILGTSVGSGLVGLASVERRRDPI